MAEPRELFDVRGLEEVVRVDAAAVGKDFMDGV